MSHESDTETATESSLSRAASNSTVVSLVRGTKTQTGQLLERTRHAVRSSYLYRWLTAEPDPEIIVIDLRDTYTVGPFISVFERLGDVLSVSMADSRIVAVGCAALDKFRAAPVRLVGIALATVCAIALLGGTVLGALSLRLIVGLGVGVVVGIGGTQVNTSWEELKQSRSAQLLSAAFTPPPEEDTTRLDSTPTETEEGKQEHSDDRQ